MFMYASLANGVTKASIRCLPRLFGNDLSLTAWSRVRDPHLWLGESIIRERRRLWKCFDNSAWLVRADHPDACSPSVPLILSKARRSWLSGRGSKGVEVYGSES